MAILGQVSWHLNRSPRSTVSVSGVRLTFFYKLHSPLVCSGHSPSEHQRLSILSYLKSLRTQILRTQPHARYPSSYSKGQLTWPGQHVFE